MVNDWFPVNPPDLTGQDKQHNNIKNYDFTCEITIINPDEINKKTQNAMLTKAEEWNSWNHEFLLQAKTYRLEDHINHRVDLLPKPQKPDLRLRKYTKTSTAARSAISQTISGSDDDAEEAEIIQEKRQGQIPCSGWINGKPLWQEPPNKGLQRQDNPLPRQTQEQKIANGSLTYRGIGNLLQKELQALGAQNKPAKTTRGAWATTYDGLKDHNSEEDAHTIEERNPNQQGVNKPHGTHTSQKRIILDSASTISITNDHKRLFNIRPARHDDYLWADIHGQYVIEHPIHEPKATFSAWRKKHTTFTKRKPLTSEALLWHGRLGHPGPRALEHLVNTSQGVRIRGPTTIKCEACALAKITRQIRRLLREILKREGKRIALDFHDYEPGIHGYNSQLLLTCRVSGYIWDYYLTNRDSDTILKILKSFLGMMELQHETKVKIIECDGEIFNRRRAVKDYLESKHIQIEPSAPNTQAQNGGAERSGGVIKEKMRALRTSSKLPTSLWPEIGRTTVYLNNRTPSYGLDWQTPYYRFFSAIAKRQGIPRPDPRPDQTHLKVFGCKAYAMTSDAQLKKRRHQRLEPRAWISYLVGYQSSNIYWI
ncbi:hypothetical protein LA080_013431 [Diaporthe eres]|nr:hypothetical protein LA080_013431 [Diaporthe eres]